MAVPASDVVRGVQTILRVTQFPRLQVDGIVGPRTISALAQVPSSMERALSEYTRSKGFDFKRLFAPIQKDVTVTGSAGAAPPRRAATTRLERGSFQMSRDQLDRSQIISLAAEVRRELPSRIRNSLSWLRDEDVADFVATESDGKVRAVAPSGLFHGLTQMGNPAWTDASRALGSRNLKPFSEGRYDPRENLKAAFGFWSSLIRAAPSYGVSIDTPEKLYAAHQQGAQGFGRLVASSSTPEQIRAGRTGSRVVDNQSPSSRVTVAQAVQQQRQVA